MFFILEDRHGYRVCWMPARGVESARRFARWIGLAGYVAPVDPYATYEAAKGFANRIPMWAVGR